MLLEEIYENSVFISDEETTSDLVVSIANQCFSVVNSKVGTNLPFFTDDNYSAETYDAVTPSWQFRLIEPYLTWAILNNDGSDNNLLNMHYQRFLDALEDFKMMGLDDIKTEDADGNPTGYEGNSKRTAKITHTNCTVNPFRGWW